MFIVAKKGALKSERPGGAKALREWQWQMTLVFLSPSTQSLLRHISHTC